MNFISIFFPNSASNPLKIGFKVFLICRWVLHDGVILDPIMDWLEVELGKFKTRKLLELNSLSNKTRVEPSRLDL